MILRGSSLTVARRFSRRVVSLQVPVQVSSFFYKESSYASLHRTLVAATPQAGGKYYDSFEDDQQGFGAFDYVPDEYDWHDMNLDAGVAHVTGDDDYYDSAVMGGAGWETTSTTKNINAWNQPQVKKNSHLAMLPKYRLKNHKLNWSRTATNR